MWAILSLVATVARRWSDAYHLHCQRRKEYQVDVAKGFRTPTQPQAVLVLVLENPARIRPHFIEQEYENPC